MAQDTNAGDLSGKTIAVLATDGFEQSELTEPVDALRGRGAKVHVIAPEDTREEGKIRGWDQTDWGDAVDVDTPLSLASEGDYDALILPGGVMNPDTLRQDEDAIAFIRAFFKSGKPVAAICHGPQILIECDVLQGRSMTSYPSTKTDLKNAGVRWSDQEVVVDQGLISSRSPADLPAFIDKIAEEILEGKHAKQATA